MLTRRRSRYRTGNREQEARSALAVFRMLAAQHPADPRYGSLAGRLREVSQEFADWWDEHDVRTLGQSARVVHHPELGRLEFERIPLDMAGTDRLRVCVFVPAPGSPTARQMETIATTASPGR